MWVGCDTVSDANKLVGRVEVAFLLGVTRDQTRFLPRTLVHTILTHLNPRFRLIRMNLSTTTATLHPTRITTQ